MKPRLVQTFWRYRELWWQLTRHNVLSRYRGAVLGLAWSVLLPLLMLAIYTVIFSKVFQARWGSGPQGGPFDVAINLFAGLIVFNLFAECLSKAPNLIADNKNYIKKIIFPLEILGAAAVGQALFNAAISLCILCGFQLLTHQPLHGTLLWIPLIWLPLVLLTLTATWLVSAAGVFVPDINQVITAGLNVLMFLSPIFYSADALPERLRALVLLNPLGAIIEQTRRVCIDGLPPTPAYVLLLVPGSVLLAELSLRSFQRMRRGFADVL